MMPTNDPLEHQGNGTQSIPLQSPLHGELEPVIGQLQSELRVLNRERAAILKRIGMIKKTVAGLADLFGSHVINGELQELLSLQAVRRPRIHPGITDLCRQVLGDCCEPVTVRQMLGRIQEKCPIGLAGLKHPANSLRVILSRLVAYGEAEELLTEKGLRTWRATVGPGALRKNNHDLPQ